MLRGLVNKAPRSVQGSVLRAGFAGCNLGPLVREDPIARCSFPLIPEVLLTNGSLGSTIIVSERLVRPASLFTFVGTCSPAFRIVTGFRASGIRAARCKWLCSPYIGNLSLGP